MKNQGKIFNIISNKLEIIGIDIDIIIILLPISILLAIAASPESLHILTANSDKNAIPVIFINNAINCVLIENLSYIDCIKFIIPVSLSITKIKINMPVRILIKIAYSGLYCFNIIIMTSAIKAIPTILIISIICPFFFGI